MRGARILMAPAQSRDRQSLLLAGRCHSLFLKTTFFKAWRASSLARKRRRLTVSTAWIVSNAFSSWRLITLRRLRAFYSVSTRKLLAARIYRDSKGRRGLQPAPQRINIRPRGRFFSCPTVSIILTMKVERTQPSFCLCSVLGNRLGRPSALLT